MEMKQHYLYPCMIHCSVDPCVISTVLGSCVAVCLFDAKRKIGGMNHYMLPLWNGEGLESPKYGNVAIKRLIKEMLSLGSDKRDLVVKVFGGANLLKSRNGGFDVGRRNIEVAEVTLREASLTIKAASLGDHFGRKILFNTANGEIAMKRLRKTSDQ